MDPEKMFQNAVQRWQQGQSLEVVARELVDALTEQEKLEMLDGDVDFWEGRIRALSLGQSNRTCPAAIVPRLGIPGFDFIDGPRGIGLGRATCFPVSMARGASFDPALETEIGEAIGRELRALGGTLFGGVCINLLRHPAWGRAQETYGEDPHLVGMMGTALSTGVQRHAMACVKHFALNSMETSRHRVDVKCAERPLHEVYLPHFRRVVESGVAVVMSAYNSLNGEWCGHSRHLITDILKDEWGFEGVVITDFIFGIRDAAKSVMAGVDIEMPYRMIRWQDLPRTIAEGAVSWSQVDTIVTRILRTLIRFEHLRQTPLPSASVVACAEHVALALRSAQESIVVLENRGVLPLAPDMVQKITVIGKLASIANLGDGGSSAVQPPYSVTLLEGVRNAFPSAEVCHAGFDVSLFGGADVAIVVVGTTKHEEGEYLGFEEQISLMEKFAPPFSDEDQKRRFQHLVDNQDTALAEPPGGDRSSLRLSAADERLILDAVARHSRVIVVLMGGSAFVTEAWRDKVAAILHVWYPGMEGGVALGQVLSGEVNPSGHLPFAIPVDEEDLAPFSVHTDTAEYGLLHGQWLLDAGGKAVRYPFGHGLSYTFFRAEHFTIDIKAGKPTAIVTWRNIGSREGDDVILIFGSVMASQYQRPARRLIGFTRVSLSEGEALTVHVDLDLQQLAIRDNEMWLWEDRMLHIEACRWAGDPEALIWEGSIPAPKVHAAINIQNHEGD